MKFTTPPGAAKYPRLDVPDTKFNSDGTFKVTLVWPGEVVSSLKDKVEALAAAHLAEMKAEAAAEKDAAKKKKLNIRIKEAEMAKSPFKDVLDDDAEPTGDVECTFSLPAVRRWKDKRTGAENVVNQRPIVVDAKGKATKAVPWSGSTMAINFTAEAGYWEGQKKVGVSLRLIAAQIIKLVQGSGQEVNPTEGFESYEDGFESYEDAAPTSAGGSAPAETADAAAEDEDDGSGNF